MPPLLILGAIIGLIVILLIMCHKGKPKKAAQKNEVQYQSQLQPQQLETVTVVNPDNNQEKKQKPSKINVKEVLEAVSVLIPDINYEEHVHEIRDVKQPKKKATTRVKQTKPIRKSTPAAGVHKKPIKIKPKIQAPKPKVRLASTALKLLRKR